MWIWRYLYIYIYTLQGINISHLGKRKIIFKMLFLGDMLVPWRVYIWSDNRRYLKVTTSWMQNSDMLHSARRLEDACSAREDWWKGKLDTCKHYEYRGRLKLSPTWISFTKLPFGGNRDDDSQIHPRYPVIYSKSGVLTHKKVRCRHPERPSNILTVLEEEISYSWTMIMIFLENFRKCTIWNY